jgi:hypothetical protein
VPNPEAVAAVPPTGDQEYVYGAVPPATVTVAVPLVPALQETSVLDIVAARIAGSVIVIDCVVVHPLASVIVAV